MSNEIVIEIRKIFDTIFNCSYFKEDLNLNFTLYDDSVQYLKFRLKKSHFTKKHLNYLEKIKRRQVN